jgi:predicted enzyme related to lactoylglutathione lyase
VASELCYFTIGVASTAQAQRFFGRLFGWEFAPGNYKDAYFITNLTFPGGLHGPQTGTGPRLYFLVDDIDEAIGRVRELGGEAGEPQSDANGTNVDCRDDQGTPFSLFSPSTAG